MRVAIPTIQHTGTKFIASMFKYHQAGFLEEDLGDTMHVGHISLGQIVNIEALLDEGLPVVIPLRHPYLVYESWIRRDKQIHELVTNWHLLVDRIDKYNPYYVAIDSRDREDMLDDVNRGLGLRLETDWSPVNVVSNTYMMRPRDIDPPPVIIKLADDIKGFLGRFYTP